MRLIDRYIAQRFFANFLFLFALLYLFAVAIDLLLNLDEFVQAARVEQGEAGHWIARSIATIGLVFDFQAPRIFQFYAYLHGLLAVGAMGFTLAQMHRYKELVAVMASGVSLQRIAMPFIGCAFVLSLLQLANSEFILPRVAPLLLRDHGQIGQHQFDEFAVPFTLDSDGNLLQAASLVPDRRGGTLIAPTYIIRDSQRRAEQRITADRAVWDNAQRVWLLENGAAVRSTRSGSAEGESLRQGAAEVVTDLSPEVLTMQRHGQFAGMLSLAQLQEMLNTPLVVDQPALVRFKYTRFSGVLVNLLVLGLCLPTFLLREPVPILPQAVKCAAIALPAMMGAAIGMMADLPGVSPAAGVFIPVIVLMLLVLARWTWMKT